MPPSRRTMPSSFSEPLLGPEGPGSGAGVRGGMFLSCRPGSFRGAREQADAYLSAWGVRHVEIALPEPEDTEQIQRELQRYGLTAGSLQVRTDVADPELTQHFAEAARRVREEFGARYIFTSVHAGEHGMEAAYAALVRAGDAVAGHGVTIVLETHPDLGTNGTVAAATMRAVNHPHVRVNWDPANVYFYNENCDGRREFDLALPYIAALHLKDTGGGFRSWDFSALGEGVVDFAYILGRLRETGFDGPCTMEIEGVRGERLTPEQYVTRVEKSVAYLRSLGYFTA